MSRLDDFHHLRSIVTDECVVWPHTNNKGYGRIRYLGRSHPAHRLALVLATGMDPPDMQAAHGPCHNRACMNVAHLRWATQVDNLADQVRDGTDNRGERHPMARLSRDEALIIRSSSESSSVLAKRFGVSRSQARSIQAGRGWRHLTTGD